MVGAENNTAARITLSEQVTKDLAITYSQDLSSSRQDIILIEYFVTRNTSIQASRDELGNFGLDVLDESFCAASRIWTGRSVTAEDLANCCIVGAHRAPLQ